MEGSKESRSCTDVPCLALFVIVVTCWIILGVYAMSVGQPYTLLLPKDNMGSRCGLDYYVKDKPYLFFLDILDCEDIAVPLVGCNSTHICVRYCPDNIFLSNDPTDLTYNRLYCLYETNIWDPTMCAKWYLPSYTHERRCIPYDNYYENEFVLKEISEIREKETTSKEFQMAVKNIKLSYQVGEISETVLYDIMSSWWKILIGVPLAVVICLLYILILRVIPLFVIWFSTVTSMICICLCLLFSVLKYVTYKNSKDEMDQFRAKLWLSAIIISSLVLGYVLLSLIASRRSLIRRINLTYECAKIFKEIPTLWFIPLLIWLMQTLVIIYSFSVGVHLATAGKSEYNFKFVSESCKSYLAAEYQWKIEEESKCEPSLFAEAVRKEDGNACSTTHCVFVGINRNIYHPYLQAFNIYVFIWFISVISAAERMVIGVMFSKWYSSKNKDTFYGTFSQAVMVTLKYHLGTLALGSIMIALYCCFLLKVVVYLIDDKAESPGHVGYWCLFFVNFGLLFSERFFSHISNCAYIFCNLKGHNFYKSAKESLDLMSKYSYKFNRLNTRWLLVLIQLWITITTGALSYMLFTSNWFIDNSSLTYGFAIVVTIMMSAYWTTLAFFSANRVALDAIFLCILVENEGDNAINDEDYQVPEAFVRLFKA